MGRNKRKVYGEHETDRPPEIKPCGVCGCRHFDIHGRDEKGRAVHRICRNCGTVSAVQ